MIVTMLLFMRAFVSPGGGLQVKAFLQLRGGVKISNARPVPLPQFITPGLFHFHFHLFPFRLFHFHFHFHFQGKWPRKNTLFPNPVFLLPCTLFPVHPVPCIP